MDTSSSRDMLIPTAVAAVALAIALVLLFSVVGHGAGGGEGAEGTDPPSEAAALIDGLADGEAVLLFRHAVTDRSQADADPQARGACDQQRNLSAEGVAQAEAIGAGLADLPVTAVYASPFCRTVDTAEAFGVGEVEVTPALISTTSGLDASAQQEIVDRGLALVATELGGDDIAVLVTHTQNIEAMAGVTVEEGDAVVLVPAAAGGFTVEGVIPAAAW